MVRRHADLRQGHAVCEGIRADVGHLGGNGHGSQPPVICGRGGVGEVADRRDGMPVQGLRDGEALLGAAVADDFGSSAGAQDIFKRPPGQDGFLRLLTQASGGKEQRQTHKQDE